MGKFVVGPKTLSLKLLHTQNNERFTTLPKPKHVHTHEKGTGVLCVNPREINVDTLLLFHV